MMRAGLVSVSQYTNLLQTGLRISRRCGDHLMHVRGAQALHRPWLIG